MLDRILARVEIEAEMRSALDQDQFTLHYQPKFCGRTGQVMGVEALVRWNHPVRGMVSPADFIPVAEDTGLIVPLGAWVLTEACRLGRRWKDTYGSTFTMRSSMSQPASSRTPRSSTPSSKRWCAPGCRRSI
ncbi:MAG: EAL domain-containing protein [Actinobacteria bacterium]|nr:EAL domain-containing protein [Actinomycetota bacterium]